MSEARGGSGWYLWLIAIILLLVAAWFLTPLPMFIGFSMGMRQIRGVEGRMQQAQIYMPAATNIALYCQSYETLGLTNEISGARLPQPLPSLGEPWATFKANQAFIEFGGGFYHYGYRLQLDATASNAQSNAWELYLDREGQDQKLLHRFVLPRSARVTIPEYISNSIAEYDRELAKSSGDIELHKAKIYFLIHYNLKEANQACVAASKAQPKYWWPRLTLALLETGRGNATEAEKELVKFVETNPSYSRYVYLAYYYQLTGKPKDAASSIEKAIAFPIVDLDDDENNTECRGYSAGVYLFQNQEYATAVKLCDSLLPIKDNGNYAKPALEGLKSAAKSAMAGAKPEFTLNPQVLPFEAYQTNELQILLGK